MPIRPAGKPAEDRASVAIPDADPGIPGQRNLAAHQVDQVALQFDDLLARTGSGDVDVAGQGQRAGAEVDRGDRLAGHPELVDHVPDARDVFEGQLARILGVHVRLGRSVDHQHVSARHPAVGFEDGEEAALLEDHVRMLCHHSILERQTREKANLHPASTRGRWARGAHWGDS